MYRHGATAERRRVDDGICDGLQPAADTENAGDVVAVAAAPPSGKMKGSVTEEEMISDSEAKRDPNHSVVVEEAEMAAKRPLDCGGGGGGGGGGGDDEDEEVL